MKRSSEKRRDMRERGTLVKAFASEYRKADKKAQDRSWTDSRQPPVTRAAMRLGCCAIRDDGEVVRPGGQVEGVRSTSRCSGGSMARMCKGSCRDIGRCWTSALRGSVITPRDEGEAEVELLWVLYERVGQEVNLFLPSPKLRERIRRGSRVARAITRHRRGLQ